MILRPKIHPSTCSSAHNAGKEHFIQALDSGSRIRYALLFLPRVVQSISIETPALKRLKTIPSRVALAPTCQQSWPNSLQSREVWFPIVAVGQITFCTCPAQMGKLFFACHKNTLFDSKSSACLSLTIHHLRCHSDPRNFVRFLSVGKCRRFRPCSCSPFIRTFSCHTWLHVIIPQKTPKLFRSHPSEFFQRFTPRFLPTSHYFGLFMSVVPRPASSSSVYSAQYLFYPFHPTIFDIS